MAGVFSKGTRFARRFSTARGAGSSRSKYAVPLLLGGSALAAGAGFALYNAEHIKQALSQPRLKLSAAEKAKHQVSVVSGTKANALYLWIHLKPNADKKKCAKIVANLQAHVDVVCPPDMRDEDDEVWAGVGFGPNFFTQVTGRKTERNFTYPHRKGDLGDMPSTGGDIFIHAKSHDRSKLFELAQRIVGQLPAGSVESFEDTYGWVYQGGRDLSGFIDGTENPADDEWRERVAVEPATGGSYVITQKWIHDHKYLQSASTKTLETAVGRSKSDSTEINRKSIQSHVARMVGSNAWDPKKPFEMVRQSQPFGSVSGDSGLFFIGYAASPENFEFMLDRMVGAGGDGHSDLIMTMSKNVKGTYWYFPSEAELKGM